MMMSFERITEALDAHIEARRSLEGIFNRQHVEHLVYHVTAAACAAAKVELAREGRLPIARFNALLLAELQRRPLVPLHELCRRVSECPYRADPANYRVGSCPCGEEGCFIDSHTVFEDTGVGDCGRLVELSAVPDVKWVLAEKTRLPCP